MISTTVTAPVQFAASAGVTSPGWLLGSLLVLVALAVVATILYSFWTRKQPRDQTGLGMTRPMLALVLVGGLIILTGASFAIDSTPDNIQTRNLLVGGMVASAAGAVAFYFASRTADSARRDLLNATFSTETVPNLVGQTVPNAQATISATSFVLKIPSGASPAAVVTSQSLAAGGVVQRGTAISVTT